MDQEPLTDNCECLFCQRTDLNLYEINENSILIESVIVDFQEIISEIFYTRIDNDAIKFICEECKDLMTQFYVFKRSAKQNLASTEIFDNLREFLESSDQKSPPVITASKNEFTVSFTSNFHEAPDEKLIIKAEDVTTFTEIIPEPEDEEIFEEDTTMQVEMVEEEENYYEENDIDSFVEENEIEIMKDDHMGMDIAVEEKIYVCECGVGLESQAELQKHMSHHKKNVSTTCCGVGFKDFKSYQIHEKAHENFEAIAPYLSSYSCSACLSLCSTQEDLLKHIALCKKTKQSVVIEKRGAFEDHFLRSLSKSSEDVGTGDFSCGHCEKRGSEQEIKVHLLLFHTTCVNCPIENRTFDGVKQIRLFSEHIRNKHPDLFEKSSLFNCRHCNRNFENNFEKLAHMKKCEKKPFECQDHCNKRFASEWLLKAHMKNVLGDQRFVCNDCGKKCVSRSDLVIHTRAHTDERPYECPVCHKFFKTSANRSSHLDIHDSMKKHECEVCGEKFQTRPILRKHKKKHDIKYLDECVCKICDKKYDSRAHLLRHLKANHGAPASLTSDSMKTFFDGMIFETNER